MTRTIGMAGTGILAQERPATEAGAGAAAGRADRLRLFRRRRHRIRLPLPYTVSFLDIGQGDATLIQVPGGATVLIDGGPGSDVIDRLKESGVTRIDAVILTHPHADHLGGLDDVLKDFPVDAVFDSGFPSSSPEYRDFLKLVKDKGISYSSIRRGQTLELWRADPGMPQPGRHSGSDDINANSVVLVARLPRA